jgi:hypothetical protein
MERLRNKVHHLFVPSHRNNFRAKILHLDMLILVLAVSVIFSAVSSMESARKVLGFATDITIERLYEKTNEQRMSHGLPPLKYSNTLANAAQNKGQDMFTHNYWAHYRPGDGTSPWDFISNAGYQYEFAGENLARDFLFSDGVVQGWMDSETHRANILRPDYDEVGFAVLNGNLQGSDTTLVVQMFGKPAGGGNSVAQAQASEIEEVAPTQAVTPEPTTSTAIIADTKTTEPEEIIMPNNEGDIVANKSGLISLESISYNSVLLMIGFLLLVLAADLYFALKLKIVRITGKNLAHGIFLATLLLGLFVIKSGLIL